MFVDVDDVVANVGNNVVDGIIDVAEVDTIDAVVSDPIDDVDNVVVVGGDAPSPVVTITVTATALATDAAANINKIALRAITNLGESCLFSRHPKVPKRVPKQKLTADHI